MLIIGAKGFAKEVLEVVYSSNDFSDIAFYDDVTPDLPKKLFDRFKVLTTLKEADTYFKTIDNRFTIGIGDPVLRRKMYYQFSKLGGVFSSTISPKVDIGQFDVEIGAGSNLLAGVILSNGVKIGQGSLLYYNAIVTHDVVLGDFVQISPGATLLGRCSVGSYSFIGSNAVILPDVVIGENVVVGAGAVVTKNIPDNTLVYGVPAVVKDDLPKLIFSDE
jgi:sugar O-acyltransferase (sialic acid O-acetyltransferase NeuD family)